MGSPVYVRYKDHILFKNIQPPIEEAIERETIGWLSEETSEIILIEHDRTIPNVELGNSESNGLILLKCCILEIRKLPLQESSEWHLNSQENKGIVEYALKPKKRKTQPKTNNQEQTHCKQ